VSQSKIERQFEFIVKANGIPTPMKEYQFAKEIGRKWRFDFCWDKRMLAVEIEGGVWMGRGRHQTGVGFQKDIEKYNAAQLLGWMVLRYTKDMLTNDPKRVIDEIKRALEMGGKSC